MRSHAVSDRLQISISATNPCHLYDLAVALHQMRSLGRYYSGYPRWKLRPPPEMRVVTRSARTLVTYACLRLPHAIRPAAHRLFRWQDNGFDEAVAISLCEDSSAFLHAMPGQALATFRAAKARGIKVVLNHASGPVRQQLMLMEDEFSRAGLSPGKYHGFDNAYFDRECAEYAMADWHCVASSIVARQLVTAGVAADRIWIVPYGANAEIFRPPPTPAKREPLKVVFAGQMALRKGLRIAFEALREVRKSRLVNFELFGSITAEMAPYLAAHGNRPWIRLHGPVSQSQLADVFRRASVLVLPSWEEAFGLVVVQAMNCGLPCIVSDRVGAGDLIEHRRNGSIFPAGDSEALAREIAWWLENPLNFAAPSLTWEAPAKRLLALSQAAA
jgi:glycosyltransferase involved in cell wall biosynthesis